MKPATLVFTIAALALAQASAMEPFGLDAVPSRSGGLITTWRELQQEVAADEAEIKQCRERPCRSPAAKRFISIVDEARRYGGRQMLGHLNRSINSAIPTTRANVPWLSPLAALSRAGDCKSYAIPNIWRLPMRGLLPASGSW